MLIKHKRIPIKQIVLVGLLPSPIKKAYYRLKGYKIGKNVKIGIGSVLVCKEASIGDNSKISFGVIITVDYLNIKRNVRIGMGSILDTREMILDDDSIIGEMVGVGGIKTEQSLLKVGKRAHIFQYSLINPTLPIILGDDSSFGYSNYIFTHASWKSALEGYPVVFAPITIGKGVWLPSNVQIFPGVSIGDNAVIGAGSIVTKDIPGGSFAVGSPARIVKDTYPPPLSDDARESRIQEIFSNYEKYMKSHNFSITRSDEGENIKLEVKQKGTTYDVCFMRSGPATLEINQNMLIIFDDDDSLPQTGLETEGMIINLKTKKRAGSTPIGEEFVRYISRYGIRFDRLD